MRKNISYCFQLLFILLFFVACKNKQTTETKTKEPEKEPAKKEEVSITPLAVKQLNEDAILEMNEPGEYIHVPAGKTKFSYEVTNFKLGTLENLVRSRNMAYYSSGSHITLILNNEIHVAQNNPEFNFNLSPGHYVALSFLTDPDFVSIKSPDAYILRQFIAGKNPAEDYDLTGPNLFYHMPSGTFSGADTRNILLDFYLVNCHLSHDGYKVKATINNKAFIIDKWIPYLIHGLPYGESTIKLELIGKDGKTIKSPFHSVTKKFHLYERQPA